MDEKNPLLNPCIYMSGYYIVIVRHIIVYVWSQYDGANIEQSTIGYGWRQNQEANLKIVGRVITWSNQQEADPTSSYVTSVIVL